MKIFTHFTNDLFTNVNAFPDTAAMTTVNVACDCKEKGTPTTTWTPDGTDRQTYIPDCTWAHQTMPLKMWN